MKTLKHLSLMVALLVVFASQAATEEFWIKLEPTVTGPYTVDIAIETNIPGSVTLAASLALRGQDPDDTFIGTNFVRVPVVDGRAKVTVDGAKSPCPTGSTLPSGKYDAVVAFHPLWKENKAVARDSKIVESIKATSLVVLKASGGSSDDAKKAAEGKRWVMENFYMGYPWDPDFWRMKFGEIEQVECTAGNPKILKMYYIKLIDMSLLVNVLKGEIVTYRMGLQHK